MNNPSDELNLHYHVPRELLDRYDSLHFHLHLSGSDKVTPVTTKFPKAATTRSITVPQHGSTDVKMLQTASGNFICAYGLEIDASGNPPPYGDIRAQVFYGSCTSNVPQTPTSSASPARFCATGLPSVAGSCNWAFSSLFNNLLPCPQIPSGGAATFYMVEWANYGTSASPFWIVGDISCFTAIPGSSTDCDDRITAPPAPLAEFILAPIGGIQPREYRLVIDATRLEVILKSMGVAAPDTTAPIVLAYEPATSTPASPEWTGGCDRRGLWRLRVTQLAHGLVGLLSLSHVAGVPLKSNLLWRGERWELMAANRLDAFRPVDLRDAAITCVVEPN